MKRQTRLASRQPKPLSFDKICDLSIADSTSINKQIQSCKFQTHVQSMRDISSISVPFEIKFSLNQADNIQCSVNQNQQLQSNILGASKVNESIKTCHRVSTSIGKGRSFKIRNTGTLKTISVQKIVKESSAALKFVPRPKQWLKATKTIQLMNSRKNLKQKQGQQIMQITETKMQSYPKQFCFDPAESRTNFTKLPSANVVESVPFSQWSIIISQAIFYGSLIQEHNLLKLKTVVSNLHKHHKGMMIVLQMYNQRQVVQLKNKITQKGIQINYIIWSKQKCFQSLHLLDISQIAKESKSNRYLIIQDCHEFIKTVYFQTTSQLQQHQSKTDKYQNISQIDKDSKYNYLKFNGIPQFMKFLHRFRIDMHNDHFHAQVSTFEDHTHSMFYQQELRQRIKISSLKKNFEKFKQVFKEEKKKQFFSVNQFISQQSVQKQYGVQKQHKLKIKIWKCFEKLKEGGKRNQNKLNEVKSKSLERKNSLNKSQSNKKMQKGKNKKSESIVAKKPQKPQKQLQQIVAELLKRNSQIKKQISKYHQKKQILQIYSSYHHF